LEVIAMKLIVEAVIFALAVAGASIVACSTTRELVGGSTSPGNRTGRIGMHFTLPTSATISTVHWAIVGPTSASGDVATGNTSIEVVIGGLLAGGYDGAGQGVTLTATDSQGDPCSSAQAPFVIIAGTTTDLFVEMTCFQNDGGPMPVSINGSIEVEASAIAVAVPNCPIISSFSLSPAEEPVGSTSAVQVLTKPPGSAVTYTSSNVTIASVTSNSDASPPGSSATVLCTSAGQITLTVSTTVPLPDGGACAPNTMSALINCESSDAAIVCPTMGQTFCSGVGCTNLQTDNNNCGTCGHACTGGEVCTAGACCLQPACNAILAGINVSGHTPPHTTCNATELAIFQKHPTSGDAGAPGACLQCAYANALLDLTGVTANAECEDLGATGDGGTPAGISECEAALACDLGLATNGTDSCGGQLYSDMAPPVGVISPLLLNAFCGAGVSTSTCGSGGAMGACLAVWRAGFEGNSDSFIINNNSNTAFPAGMGNNIVGGLMTSCASQCFP
jgi:hypothetical protein